MSDTSPFHFSVANVGAYRWDLPKEDVGSNAPYQMPDAIRTGLQAVLRGEKAIASGITAEIYTILRINGLNEQADKLFLSFSNDRVMQTNLIHISHGRDLLWTLSQYPHAIHNYLPRAIQQLMNNQWSDNPNRMIDLMTVAGKYAAEVIPGTFDRLVAMLRPSLIKSIGSVLPAISLILSNHPNPLQLLKNNRAELQESGFLGWWVENRYPMDAKELKHIRTLSSWNEVVARIDHDMTQRKEVVLDLTQVLGRSLGGYMVQFL